MGGEIGVRSTPGQGSEFWFTVRLGQQPLDRHSPCPPPSRLHEMRVLVVDDNATQRDILIPRLASWEMRPSAVPDAVSAMQALEQALADDDPFQLVLIDMQMPGLNGADLGRMIQADARFAGVRMVIVVSLGSTDHPQYFEELGFAGFMTKPIGHQELKAILSRIFEETSGPSPRPIVMRRTARETLRSFHHCKWRVLLAEDNITNQQVALNILRKLGLHADAVANGVEALKALETLPYDLVLMDVQMPEMDGLEATRRIRNGPSAVRNSQVPIIAMTANAMQGDRAKCLEVKMDDYVPKPVSPQSLAEVLNKWLPQKNGVEALEYHGPDAPLALSASTLFDRAGMLARLMNDESLLHTVSSGFLLDIPKQIVALQSYLENGNLQPAERQAHTIKGAAANVGGNRLREVALKIEQTARDGKLQAAQAAMPALQAEFEALKQAMTQER